MSTDFEKLRDKCRGSIVCGAVGDALGYEVEFDSLSAIRKMFGEEGISRYVTHGGVAQFSDDTQMTLFTAEGLLNGVYATRVGKPESLLPFIREAYLNWYKTQTVSPEAVEDSWLAKISALWNLRAPGNTCLTSLRNISAGIETRNNSKGCGGVMRVAPIGVFSVAHPQLLPREDAACLAGWAAEVTHHHVASTFASAMLAFVVDYCIQDEIVTGLQFRKIVTDGLQMMSGCFPGNDERLKHFCSLISRALDLGEDSVDEEKAIRELGEGWIGDEALAIAVFSVMRHIDNIEKCIICAVNHDGDSDSTGAIAGNIIGAIHGYSAIPNYYLESLELKPILLSIADDLCADIAEVEDGSRLADRYVKHLPVEVDTCFLLR